MSSFGLARIQIRVVWISEGPLYYRCSFTRISDDSICLYSYVIAGTLIWWTGSLRSTCIPPYKICQLHVHTYYACTFTSVVKLSN